MNFIHFIISGLAFYLSMIFYILFIFFISLSVHIIVRFDYYSKNSKEQSLYLFYRLEKYLKNISFFLLNISLAFSFTNIFKSSNLISKLFIILLAYLIFNNISNLIYILITHNLISKIRNTNEKLNSKIRKYQKDYIFKNAFFISCILALYLILAFNLSVFSNIYLKATLFIVSIAILGNVFAPFYNTVYDYHKLEDIKLELELRLFLKKANIEDFELMYFLGKEDKNANAMLRFTDTCTIIFSDYLLSEFNIDEIKIILAHEMGHFMNKDPLKKMLGFCFYVYLFPLVLNIYEFITKVDLYDFNKLNVFSFDIFKALNFDIFIIYILAIIYFVLYFFVRPFYQRMYEYKADEYIFKLGLNFTNYESTINKIMQMNNAVFKLNKFDELFSSHPCFFNRIKKAQKYKD